MVEINDFINKIFIFECLVSVNPHCPVNVFGVVYVLKFVPTSNLVSYRIEMVIWPEVYTFF